MASACSRLTPLGVSDADLIDAVGWAFQASVSLATRQWSASRSTCPATPPALSGKAWCCVSGISPWLRIAPVVRMDCAYLTCSC